MKINLQFLITLSAVFFLGVFLGFFLSRDILQHQRSQDPVYAVVEGQGIKASDVLPQIQSDLMQLERNQYDLKKRAVEEMIQRKFSAQAPATSLERVEVTDQELELFLKSRSLERKKLSQSQLQDIEENLKLQKRKEIEKKAQPRVQIRWKLPLPPEDRFQIRKGSLAKIGAENAPVEIFVIGNFHCPTCQEAGRRLQELNQKYKDQLSVGYRFHFQEADDSMVRITAEASYCANDEGKFWTFHDRVANQGTVRTTDELKMISQGLGLNPEKFSACLSERKYKMKLNEELAEIQNIGPVQVPSFVINGRLRSASLPLDELSIVIDSELP